MSQLIFSDVPIRFTYRLFPAEDKTRIKERCLTFLDETDDIASVSLTPSSRLVL